jgi:hypothetical protein
VSFPISGSTLGIDSHTITVHDEIWHGIAYAPFSEDIVVTVTG